MNTSFKHQTCNVFLVKQRRRHAAFTNFMFVVLFDFSSAYTCELELFVHICNVGFTSLDTRHDYNFFECVFLCMQPHTVPWIRHKGLAIQVPSYQVMYSSCDLLCSVDSRSRVHNNGIHSLASVGAICSCMNTLCV